LAAVLAPLAILFSSIGFARSGMVGIAAAAIALGVCWFSASLALACVYVGQEIKNPIAGILGGMIVRMGLPLAVGLLIQRSNGPLADAGCFLMILGLYLVALVVETWLSLRLVRRDQPKSAGSEVSASSAVSAGGPSVASGISGR
jgi:cytochrome bd-type quinol oxidase subunit 1